MGVGNQGKNTSDHQGLALLAQQGRFKRGRAQSLAQLASGKKDGHGTVSATLSVNLPASGKVCLHWAGSALGRF